MISPRKMDWSRWRLGVFAALAVAFITSIPQFCFWVSRGAQWQGAYAVSDPDELAYSAYINSLIQNRSRINNPYASASAPDDGRREHLFSIQFVPAFAVAFFAKALGISAATAFILLTPLMAFASAIVLYWLLRTIVDHDGTAAVGAMLVLLCGLLVSELPFAAVQDYGTFAFLRRYVPAVPFPLFLLFFGVVFTSYTRPAANPILYGSLAGLILGLLVFSYFYLWTGAAAWLFCFTCVWLLAHPADWRRLLTFIGAFILVATLSLLPYFRLLSRRAEIMDSTHALVLTHAPDLVRFTVIIGLLMLAVIAWCSRRGVFSWRSASALFSASCAITPLVVFNQHVLTGRSLQPFHYEQFIVNYLVLIGLVAIYPVVGKLVRIRPALWVLFALIIGVVTAVKSYTLVAPMSGFVDRSIPVMRATESLKQQNGANGAVLFDQELLATSTPTFSQTAMLWSPYSYTFGGREKEELERFYQYLYYLGIQADELRSMLKPINGGLQNSYWTTFGLHKANTKLVPGFRPISAEEIENEVKKYSTYIAAFSESEARRRPLCCAVLQTAKRYDLSNLDLWYERTKAQEIGGFTLYGLRPRQ